MKRRVKIRLKQGKLHWRNRARPILIELFLPAFASDPPEVWRLNILDRYDLKRWRDIVWAYTATL